MSETIPKSFVKIGDGPPQKCSVLPEYSHLLAKQSFLFNKTQCTLETTADKSQIFTVYTYSSELLDLMWFQCGRLAVIGIFGLSSMGEE